MSAYVEFFIRGKSKEFIEVGAFGRSSATYAAFEHFAPWEKATLLNKAILNEIQLDVEKDIENFKRLIEKEKECLSLIATMNNSVEEKLEAICQSQGAIADFEESVGELEYVKYFICFLKNIMDGYEKPLIYVGIEVGTPTEEDIV